MRGDVGFEIKCIANLIKRRLDNMEIDGISDVTGLHGRIIGYVYRCGDKPVFQRDVETAFVIRRSTATGVLKLMESNGLIERVSVSGDKRLKRIVLTQKAIRYHELLTDEIDTMERSIVEGFEPEEITLLKSYIERIKLNLSTEGR